MAFLRSGNILVSFYDNQKLSSHLYSPEVGSFFREVHQQADLQSRRLQVGAKLAVVRPVELLDCLELQDHFVVDKDVDTV